MSREKNTLIKQAIIPAAGWGTRFFPFTKTVAKELVPINDTPAIEYVVREAQKAGISTIYFITNDRKIALKEYFDPTDPQMRTALKNNPSLLQKCDELDAVHASMNIHFIAQEEQKGLGHAILMARDYITDPFFAVLLPDDLVFGPSSFIGGLAQCAQQHNACVIGVQKVAPELSSSYGIIDIKKEINSSLFAVSDLVEKPQPQNAPSDYGIIGRYILNNTIFNALEKTAPDQKGEIQLTNALRLLVKTGEFPILAQVLPDNYTRADVGTPGGLLQANILVCNL